MKSAFIRLGAATICVLFLSTQGSSPVMAQSGTSTSNTAPVCMVRASASGDELVIVLPTKDVGSMEAKGFSLVPCNQKFGSQARLEAYRDSICTISSNLTEEQQQKFEQARGERPAVLCGMAEVTIGQWVRKGK